MPFTDEELIKIRRELHQIPEIGMEEFKTQAYLLEKIKEMTQNVQNIDIRTWKTAILVKVKGEGTSSQKIIGWRTDMDALPVTEATGLPFSSQHPGKMHACGHDLHMTIALGLLKKAIEDQTPAENDLLFLFQPAEENLSGAKLLFDAGIFGEDLPDEFYALHVNPDLAAGTIATNNHTLFAGACEVYVTFTGKGGHAAFPQDSNDMIIAASHFITQVQSIISRNINPLEAAVITFGTLQAGEAVNVIAKEAKLSGTIRTLTKESSQLTRKRLSEIAHGIAASFDCQAEIQFKQGGYLPLINDLVLANQMMDFLKSSPLIRFEEISPLMTGEDFAYLLDKTPGVMVWLGVNSDYPLHHGQMSPDEAVIAPAVELLSQWLKSRRIEKSHL
ncbi:N-acetyldiaminopimelate deacetylase [Lactovum odontotermitis]